MTHNATSGTANTPSPLAGEGWGEGGATRLLDLLQVVDRSFPTGAFVHSAGLEWLAGEKLLSLQDVLRLRLSEQLGRFELVFLLRAYEGNAVALDARYHARLMAREAREASSQVGRQFLENGVDLFDDAELGAFAARTPHAHYPISFAVVARALEIPIQGAALTYAFQTVRGQVSAAQRLTRLGQTEAQRLIHSLKPAIEDAVAIARETPLELAGGFAPILDIAAMAHERQPVRLFVS
ncbi:MAG TPA: urease accessory UreF family protein [Chloroflexota bacterium]